MSNLTQRQQCEEPQGVSHTQESKLWATSLLKSSFRSLSFFSTLLRFSWFWILSTKHHASLFPSAFCHTLSPKFLWNPKSFPLLFLLTMPFPFVQNWSLSFHKTPSEPIALLCLSYITAQTDAINDHCYISRTRSGSTGLGFSLISTSWEPHCGRAFLESH